jgi:hypothetical protein
MVEVVEANEPRLIALNSYVNEDGTEATIVQVHPDPDSMLFRPGDDQAAGGVGGPAQPQDPPPRRLHPIHRWLRQPGHGHARKARRHM